MPRSLHKVREKIFQAKAMADSRAWRHKSAGWSDVMSSVGGDELARHRT